MSIILAPRFHCFAVKESLSRKSPTNDTSPPGRSNAALGYSNSSLYIFGGLNQTTGWLGDVWKGDLGSDNTVTWTQLDSGDALTPRDKMAFCQSENVVYLIGGFGPIEGIEDEADEEEDSGELKAEKETQQAMQLGWFDEVLEFDLSSCKITEVTWTGFDGVAGKAAANAYYSDGNIYIFGGRSPTGRRYINYSFSIFHFVQ